MTNRKGSTALHDAVDATLALKQPKPDRGRGSVRDVTDTEKSESSYIALASEFDAYVIVNHDAMVCYARIVGVEINGEDTNDDRLVAIVHADNGRIYAHRIEKAFHHECYADAERTYRISRSTERFIERIKAADPERFIADAEAAQKAAA